MCSRVKGRLYLGMEWAELESFSIRGLERERKRESKQSEEREGRNGARTDRGQTE